MRRLIIKRALQVVACVVFAVLLGLAIPQVFPSILNPPKTEKPITYVDSVVYQNDGIAVIVRIFWTGEQHRKDL